MPLAPVKTPWRSKSLKGRHKKQTARLICWGAAVGSIGGMHYVEVRRTLVTCYNSSNRSDQKLENTKS